MVQPWDYWHVAGGSGLTVYNTRERHETTSTSTPVIYAPKMLTASPFWVGDEGITISQVSISLATSTEPGACRFGIYACPPASAHDMYPTSLIADLGELTLSGSFRPVLSITPLTLSVGFYYIATIISSMSKGYGNDSIAGPSLPLGYSTSNGVGFIGFSTYQEYGPMPSIFPPLAAGSFGVAPTWAAGATRDGDYAFYIESKGATAMTVDIDYNATTPAGTAEFVTNTSSSISVRYGSNTSPATVAALLAPSTNIASAISVGTSGNLPNANAVGRSATQLQLAGPLLAVASNVAQFIPVTAISIQS